MTRADAQSQAMLERLKAGPATLGELATVSGLTRNQVQCRMACRIEAGTVLHQGRASGRNEPLYTLTEQGRRIRLRPCLGCGAPFASEGAHNRLCQRCRSHAASASPYAY